MLGRDDGLPLDGRESSDAVVGRDVGSCANVTIVLLGLSVSLSCDLTVVCSAAGNAITFTSTLAYVLSTATRGFCSNCLKLRRRKHSGVREHVASPQPQSGDTATVAAGRQKHRTHAHA